MKRAWKRSLGRSPALVAFALLGPSLGCKPPETESPDDISVPDVAADAGPGGAGTDPGVAEAPEVAPPTDDAAKPKVVIPKDRDQAEEKRKMAESRKISAVAVQKLKGGQLDAAISESRKALRVHEQNVEAMLTIAEAFYKQGKFEIVQSVATSILEVDPKVLMPQEKSRAYNLRGFAYLAENKQGSALTAFRQAAETDEKNATAWNNLGVMYILQEDWKTSESCFKYAVELDPSFVKARLNWGSSLRALGQLQQAEKAWREVLQDRPNLADVHFNLGVLYLDADPFPNLQDKERLEKAIGEFETYKSKSGVSRPGGDAPRPSSPASSGSSVASALPGMELVSPTQADLYIEVANKGLARIARKEERDKKRAEKAAKEKAEAEAKAKQEAEQAAEEAQKPGAQKPGAQKPGGNTPPADTPPADEPSAEKPPSEQPPADEPPADKPPADKPPASKPGAQKPGAQKPGAQKPGAQKPGAQKPGAQKPGAQKPSG